MKNNVASLKRKKFNASKQFNWFSFFQSFMKKIWYTGLHYSLRHTSTTSVSNEAYLVLLHLEVRISKTPLLNSGGFYDGVYEWKYFHCYFLHQAKVTKSFCISVLCCCIRFHTSLPGHKMEGSRDMLRQVTLDLVTRFLSNLITQFWSVVEFFFYRTNCYSCLVQ